MINFIINFIIFPYALFIAIKNKMFHWQGNLGNCKIKKISLRIKKKISLRIKKKLIIFV